MVSQQHMLSRQRSQLQAFDAENTVNKEGKAGREELTGVGGFPLAEIENGRGVRSFVAHCTLLTM